jgi:imidazolonepropionase-like amidohydrolase
MPGLVDMHVHLFNLSSHRPPNDWSFPLYVANGITAVREMRGDAASMTLVHRWQTALDDGELVAPRILAAGISVYGASPEDARRQVDAAAEAGADFIKVFSEVPASHWRAILAAAQAHSLPVVGHVPAGVPLLVAAAAGQRSDEHLMQAFEACSSIEAGLLEPRRDLAGDALIARRDAQESEALEAFDPTICWSVAKTLATSGQVQVPTLVLADEDSLAKNGPPSADPRWRYLRPDERARWQRFFDGYTVQDAALARQRWPVARQIVSAMHEAGVTIMAGTDSPMPGVYPGFALHEELELLVASGLTPPEALRSATLEPARFLGIADKSGSVAVGKRADLLLLDADPTKDIRNTRRIHAVLIDGRLLRSTDLDALLKQAERP